MSISKHYPFVLNAMIDFEEAGIKGAEDVEKEIAIICRITARLDIADMLAEALETVEWDEDGYCQWCHCWQEKKEHLESCQRQAALRQYHEVSDGETES